MIIGLSKVKVIVEVGNVFFVVLIVEFNLVDLRENKKEEIEDSYV